MLPSSLQNIAGTRRRAVGLVVSLSLALAPAALLAQDATDPWTVLRAETFVKPPAHVERMIMTPRVDIAFDAMSPDGRWALRLTGPDRGRVAAWGKPHLILAAVQVDPQANRARSLTTQPKTGITLADPRTGQTRALQTPAGATISDPTWSPSGDRIGYIANFETASFLYIVDVASGRSTQLTRMPLLATLVTGVQFTADGRHIITVIVPANRGPAPTHGPEGIEDGPQVRHTESTPKPQPVYASLLEDPHDKALLKYHTTGQLALVDTRSRAVRTLGAPAMIRSVDVSPDSRYLRVTTMQEPFSYLVPANNFPTKTELWDIGGRVITVLGTTPLREERPQFGGGGAGGAAAAADTGKRNLQWHPESGLTYLQSILGGNGRPVSVRLVHWRAPFGTTDTATIVSGSARFTNAAWSKDARTLFVNDSGEIAALRVTDLGTKYKLGRGVTLPSGGSAFGGGGGGGGGSATTDTIGTGGALAITRTANGAVAVVTSRDGQHVFVSGQRSYGAEWHRRGPRPWMDRLTIETAARARIFDGQANLFEQVVAALDDDHTELVFTRQSPTMIEDAWHRTVASGAERKLTAAVDVGPEVSGAIRKRIQVTRPRDGIPMWVEVVLPRSWQAGAPVPGIIWFYPREYATAEAYERSRYSTNINRFPAVPQLRPASATELWVAGGYALITPEMPIFGDSGKMNDHFTRDLRDNLSAILNAAVDSGFVDRSRMGIGGHSYGAFGTVNAMTLMPDFKAGIAGDGMYNRSLTPFGFQSERRNFYEAQGTYLDMSPFFRADRLSGALLLYHGLEDQNSGTAPMSSTRMMAALQGLGKTASLYMYPYEDHSVATYESDLDMWARWLAWFDVYVKNPKPADTTAP
jgi:dipeptidyl aminopeptidase/acylaminoacyl peptidase